MRIAVISDVHGNLVALDSVLQELRRENVDQIVALGDMIQSGPQPAEVTNGPSEQAPINVIAGKISQLPEGPQMIFAWTPILSDTRVINLADRGTLDLALGEGDMTIGEIR